MTPDQIARASSCLGSRARMNDGRNAYWISLGIMASALIENDMPLTPERLYKSAARLANRRLSERFQVNNKP